ncbi:MAG: hypothetical protein M3Q95_15065 [Bacteroidota bacterium]|nr:hypothetical protein [Bacteroidota bacterium]
MQEFLGLCITNTYVSLIRNEVKLRYPDFYFERGVIVYDYESEMYVYSGFSSEEQRILREAEKALLAN